MQNIMQQKLSFGTQGAVSMIALDQCLILGKYVYHLPTGVFSPLGDVIIYKHASVHSTYFKVCILCANVYYDATGARIVH